MMTPSWSRSWNPNQSNRGDVTGMINDQWFSGWGRKMRNLMLRRMSMMSMSWEKVWICFSFPSLSAYSVPLYALLKVGEE